MTTTPESTRFHGLDALRGSALLLGVLLHAMMPWFLPPGFWAIGTTEPVPLLGWATYYIHSFRMETFFLLAGFFAALVIERKGVRAFLRDRALRILLIFAVALYPMKFLLTTGWIAGGRVQGWLPLPAEALAQPWWVITLGGLAEESWPAIRLTHLWFLYYLTLVVALFLAARALLGRSAALTAMAEKLAARLRQLAASAWAPWLLALFTWPLLAQMQGMDIDTPDSTFAWNLPVLALYLGGFALGYALYGPAGHLATLFAAIAGRWRSTLAASLVVSLPSSILVGIRYSTDAWVVANADALRWASAAGTALTMWLALFGWLGLFQAKFAVPSPFWRELADASYFLYLTHLPVLVALQVALHPLGLAWWLELPLLLLGTLAVLAPAWRWLVRPTWVGAWLRGKRLDEAHPSNA